jgi:hypothetical protein
MRRIAMHRLIKFDIAIATAARILCSCVDLMLLALYVWFYASSISKGKNSKYGTTKVRLCKLHFAYDVECMCIDIDADCTLQ